MRLGPEDLRVVGHNLGRFGRILVLLLVPPLLVALVYSEFEIIPSILISISISWICCELLEYCCSTDREMELKHALAVAAALWLFAPFMCSIALWTSGGYSFADGFFESMSGFTGTGLTMTKYPEMLPRSINFLRHLLQFAGDGIGIVVISLCIFGRTDISSYLIFKGEMREAGIRPSVVGTSRRILGIAVTFMLLGTLLFTLVGIREGLEPREALFDGLNHSMSAYSTGGFSTRSQSLLYYHSPLLEVIAMIFMILGSLNFNLHYAVLTGKRGEVLKDIEVKVFAVTMLTGCILLLPSLFRFCYKTPAALFRKGFFQLVSAQTTTGFQTVPSTVLGLWPVSAIFVLTVLMLIGGSANSTSGGIKNLRVGILFKSLFLEMKRIFLPKSAVIGEFYYHLGNNPISETVLKGVAVITLSYLVVFTFGVLITTSFGYPLQHSMFETASALCNTGLSCGITSPSMPIALKLTYIVIMWMGRLEIIAAVALFLLVLLVRK